MCSCKNVAAGDESSAAEVPDVAGSIILQRQIFCHFFVGKIQRNYRDKNMCGILLTLYPKAACQGKADTGASRPPTTFGNSLTLIPHSSRPATVTFVATGKVVVGIGVAVVGDGENCSVAVLVVAVSASSVVSLFIESVVASDVGLLVVVVGFVVVLDVVMGFDGGL